MNPILVVSKDAPTELVGSEFMLSPGQERTFRGAPFPRHRRQIIISHEGTKSGGTGIGASAHLSLGAANNSQPENDGTGVGDIAATPPKVMTIFPVTNVTVFTNSDVTIRNNSIYKLLLRVAESFYT
jgi:hypothetical protein